MTAIEECDVEDKVKLTAYREKRIEWLHMLSGDKHHSVSTQISEMLWNDAVFRTVNEARRLARAGGYKSSALNWSIARFMDQGWVAWQALAIRKLMERAAAKPEKQVISLRRVIDEISENRKLITRENYVCYDGLPYDPEPGRAALEAYALASERKPRLTGLPTKGPYAWHMATMCHEEFDKLSGISADKRSRGDLIMPAVFEQIEKELSESGWRGISDIANKFIAHAADEYSRSKSIDDEIGFSLDMIERCHRAICRAFAQLYGPILWQGSHGLFPIPQFNYFENLEVVWLRGEDVTALEKFWRQRTEQVKAWANLSSSEPDIFDEIAKEQDAKLDLQRETPDGSVESASLSFEGVELDERRKDRDRQ